MNVRPNHRLHFVLSELLAAQTQPFYLQMELSGGKVFVELNVTNLNLDSVEGFERLAKGNVSTYPAVIALDRVDIFRVIEVPAK